MDAVIFDVGGVIMHSDPADYDAIGTGIGLASGALWAAIHDIPEYQASRTGEISNAEFREAILRRLATVVGGPDAEAAIVQVEALYQDSDPVRPVMREMLQALRGRVKLGLLSNAPRGSTAKAQASGLAAMFDATVFTGDAGVAKPDPRAYRLIAQLLHVAPERCLYVDDVAAYVDAAKQLGMRGHVYHWSRHAGFETVLRNAGLLDRTHAAASLRDVF